MTGEVFQFPTKKDIMGSRYITSDKKSHLRRSSGRLRGRRRDGQNREDEREEQSCNKHHTLLKTNNSKHS